MEPNLDDLTVLNDLRDRLKAITPEQVEACGRKLKDDKLKNEKVKVIGVVEPYATRTLWTLACLLRGERLLEHAKAHNATDETTEKDHTERAAVLDMFADVARELFWAQAKVDLGFHKEASVGLRADWVLAERLEQDGPGGFMAQILGGKMMPSPEE